jgi:glutamate N-acetyltransferase/amino-acid N-acetyltransferase
MKKEDITIQGFRFAGISAGIKQQGKKDIALIFSETLATVAGVFTTNRIKAAPVRLDIKRIRSGKGQAIIINSGNANACTGDEGLRDASEMAECVARELNIGPEHVYVSSTGIIGRPLPMARIRKAIPSLVKRLSPSSIMDTATAIMTTDTFPKVSLRKLKLSRTTGTIVGIAKGAGMICPNMATMLCFILTDIAIRHDALDRAIRGAVRRSFNRLIIDNDMSTNDTVIIMANGRLGNKPLTKDSPFYRRFEEALSEVTYELARMIAIDGEGATKLINVIVKGARTESDAERVARAIAQSMLVKTAIYGEDPNWGRIMAAIGYSGVDVLEDRIDIYINGRKYVAGGRGSDNKKRRDRALAKREINITVDLGLGNRSASVLTCDLTEGYIRINSEYTS